MAAKEFLIAPESPHHIIRPFSRMTDQLINKYSGLTGGREELLKMAPLAKTGSPFVVLTETEDGNRRLDLLYLGEIDSNNHGKFRFGIEGFNNGSYSEIKSVWVDPNDLQTEQTGITKEMVLAAKKSSQAGLAKYATLQEAAIIDQIRRGGPFWRTGMKQVFNMRKDARELGKSISP